MRNATDFVSPTIHGRRATSSTAVVIPMTRAAGPRARVDAGGSRLRLRALHVMGHGAARISRALGVREETIQRLVRGDTTVVSPNLRDAITELYDAWWDKRAPERTRAERAAAARARRRAAAGNWCAGAALDDDQLDKPGYRPLSRWRPATGTGTAPDIYPQAHPDEEARMTDQRMNPELIHDILDVLDRHGYARADDEHTRRAVLLISDLAHIYEGAQDHPFGPYNEVSRSRTEPAPEPAAQDTVTVPAGEVTTLLAALDIAADYKRDRAAVCADCTSQSCPTCQSCLQHARAYDRLAAHLIHATEASAAATASQLEPTADREAGQ